jgi:TatD DNase family protein
MLIDTHCHIDQFPSPEQVVRACEEKSLRVVAVTNLPSHFALSADRLRGHPLLSPALGIHPMAASEGIHELASFKRMATHVDYIGEIGLDFSRHGQATKELQERVFEQILSIVANRKRFITLHSRGAEIPVLEALRRHRIRGAVFHWFTGTSKELERVISDGHFVSLNPAMLFSTSGKSTFVSVPKESVLVESDGPFAKLNGRTSHPRDVTEVYRALSLHWKMSFEMVVELVANNFDRITKMIADPQQKHHNQPPAGRTLKKA